MELTISITSVKASAVFDKKAVRVCPKYPLYSYQRQVLADIFRALSSPQPRAVAHLPTGAGKTRIAAHAACHFLNEKDTKNFLVIWLAASEELCEQAADELSGAWRYLGRREAFVHRYWGNRTLDLRRLPSGFLISGLGKLRSVAFQDNTVLAHLAHCTAAVIFDEAHQAVAKTYFFITEQLCSTRPPLLGLTATPGRTANITDEDYRLASIFNHKKVSINPRGHGNPVTYLIQNGYLADPCFKPISFDSDASVTEPKPGMDYNLNDLNNLGRSEKRSQKIAELAHVAVKRHPRTIVFCPSVDSALNCDKLLRSKGIATNVVTANTPGDDRLSFINSFRSDSREHMVLFNYGVLTAGFDAPRTRCAIIARPTTSLVLYSQMVGRAMRGRKSGGNSKAEIFTVVDTNLPGFGSITDAFTNWEELWTTDSKS